jgi:hypothetical protein
VAVWSSDSLQVFSRLSSVLGLVQRLRLLAYLERQDSLLVPVGLL